MLVSGAEKKLAGRLRRHRRVRKRISGSTERPRLSVFRSQKHIYAQIVDDTQGRTLVAISSLSPDLRQKLKTAGNRSAAAQVGRLLAEKAKAAGITAVVFDRGGYLYHGRIQSLADAAREGGLVF